MSNYQYRQGGNRSRIPTKCRWGDKCSKSYCDFCHPWNENWKFAAEPRDGGVDSRPSTSGNGWSSSRQSDNQQGYYGTGANAPLPQQQHSDGRPKLIRRRTSEDHEQSEEREAKRARFENSAYDPRTGGWERPGSSSGTGSNTPSVAQGVHTRFGPNLLDNDSNTTPISPSIGSPNLSSVGSAIKGQRDPRQRTSSSLVPSSSRPSGSSKTDPIQSPATNVLGFLSPSTSALGVGSAPENMSSATALVGDVRASQIIVAEANNMPLDQIRNPHDVLQFIMRRMSAAIRTNVMREDLISKHIVLKSLRQTVGPLALPGSSTQNQKIDQQLDDSRREIARVDQKLQRYQMEAEVGWRQLGLTIALGHLPSMAEIRDVEGVRNWIDGLKNEMGQYLEVRMRDEVQRAENRVAQAAATARPKDEYTERRLFELKAGLDDMRTEMARQKRLDTSAVYQRLEALEKEMKDRRRLDAEAQAEMESLSKRQFELEEVFAFTRQDLDSLMQRVDGAGAGVDRINDVENELRAIIDSAIGQVPDQPTLVNTILDRLSPHLAALQQKQAAYTAAEIKKVQTQLNNRLLELGIGNTGDMETDEDEDDAE